MHRLAPRQWASPRSETAPKAGPAPDWPIHRRPAARRNGSRAALQATSPNPVDIGAALVCGGGRGRRQRKRRLKGGVTRRVARTPPEPPEMRRGGLAVGRGLVGLGLRGHPGPGALPRSRGARAGRRQRRLGGAGRHGRARGPGHGDWVAHGAGAGGAGLERRGHRLAGQRRGRAGRVGETHVAPFRAFQELRWGVLLRPDGGSRLEAQQRPLALAV